MRPPAAAALAGAALVSACGAPAPLAGACTPSVQPSATRPSALDGPVRITADRGAASGGETVRFTVDVTGPVRYAAACSGPVTLVIVDPANLHVAATAPAAPRGAACGSVDLTAAQHTEYTVDWQVDGSLPGGRYTALVSVGDRAPVSIPVLLSAPGGACD